jgi:hypothetical protein
MFHVKHFRLKSETASAARLSDAAVNKRAHLHGWIEVVAKDAVFGDSFCQQQGRD